MKPSMQKSFKGFAAVVHISDIATDLNVKGTGSRTIEAGLVALNPTTDQVLQKDFHLMGTTSADKREQTSK
jgi:hypothetical protein